MEAFSLLKYWRGGGAVGAAVGGNGNGGRNNSVGATRIITSVSPPASETDEDNDDGPFFDLEFTVPDEEDEDERVKDEESDGCNGGDNDDDKVKGDYIESEGSDSENESEFKLTLSSGSSADRTDPNVELSPSDDLFFKGRLVPVESSSLVFNGSEPNSKSQFPASLLRSATKFRVLMLKFKKSKSNVSEKTESNGSASGTPKPQQKQQTENHQQQQNQPHNNKFFTVKFKVEEVPIVSLFTRDSSSKGANSKAQKPDESTSDDKRFSKDVMQRYLKMVKPLYIRVSKRYGEKLGFSGQLSLSGTTKDVPSPASTEAQKSPPAKSTTAKSESEPREITESAPPSNAKGPKQGNLPGGLQVVRKHLGKSRSASSAVAAAPPAAVASSRRDDSLLQQQDGIQSAILHCKRSFNASRDSSILSRSASDPSSEKSMSPSATDCCSVETKETCI